ncbi:hypothetical protein TEA_020609 [Camellia sinensis var. sinensis]|uniref:RING-type E3 ubiquitin transferase n=1 Tax=Camellia sinensis var. sinensis TaxID=542762 RepID=A0A4S4EJ50_CAMSN|nr:hypothetical protein TEA_020609 [Camellia sinensis var. sinensis]
MSGSGNNLRPTPGNRLPGQGYRDWNRVHTMFPRPQNSPPIQERITGRPLGLTSFPVSPLSPMELGVLNEMARVINGRPRQYIPQPPPRFTEQQWTNMQVPTQEGEQSRLSPDEQKKALKMLKKEIYNPKPKTTAKHLAHRLNLYYRDTSYATSNSFVGKEIVEDEEGKRCAICLDDFEPKQWVTLTPCNHMFHEECIVPWVKSHGQCPVCRFAICERMGQNAMPVNNNYTAQIPASDFSAHQKILAHDDNVLGFSEHTTGITLSNSQCFSFWVPRCLNASKCEIGISSLLTAFAPRACLTRKLSTPAAALSATPSVSSSSTVH